MTVQQRIRTGLAVVLALILIGAVGLVARHASSDGRTIITAYFDNSNGIYPGDEVRILGVDVGKIATIEPQPLRAKITFWVDSQYRIPAGVNAVILSPSLVTSRAIQLTPAYTNGPALHNHAVISQDRTAVPMEWDDLRSQLQKLTDLLQPTTPSGVSTLGEFVNTAANNLRGQGANIRDMVLKLSQAISALGDHSGDIFGTVKNLATLVSALRDSTDLMREFNQNAAAVTAMLAADPNAISNAVTDLNTAAGDVRNFVAENRQSLGATSDKLAEVAQALGESIDDIKQTLHVAPTALSNYVNIYEPAQGAVTGALSGTNFSNPINFLCGAIQAASRLGAEQSAKLCVQYLAPIFKNRQYNALGPLGFNMFVGPQARPNEVTYSEDWLRPDYVPPAPGEGPAPVPGTSPPVPDAPLAATVPPPADGPAVTGTTAQTDPAAGLSGMMIPPGAGS